MSDATLSGAPATNGNHVVNGMNGDSPVVNGDSNANPPSEAGDVKKLAGTGAKPSAEAASLVDCDDAGASVAEESDSSPAQPAAPNNNNLKQADAAKPALVVEPKKEKSPSPAVVPPPKEKSPSPAVVPPPKEKSPSPAVVPPPKEKSPSPAAPAIVTPIKEKSPTLVSPPEEVTLDSSSETSTSGNPTDAESSPEEKPDVDIEKIRPEINMMRQISNQIEEDIQNQNVKPNYAKYAIIVGGVSLAVALTVFSMKRVNH